MRRLRAGALEDQEQMKIFQLSNPKKAFLEYISALYNEETDSEHENSDDNYEEFDDNYEEFDMMNPLCDKVLHQILKHRYAPQVILAYIKELPYPCAEEDLRDYLILSNADQIMLELVKQHGSNVLSAEARNLIQDLPNAKEIMAAM